MYKTSIGELTLTTPIYNAAGVWDTSQQQCQGLQDTVCCAATVTKTCTINARTGNRYPKYYFDDSSYSINSNGLENYGLEYYLQMVTPSKYHPVIYSLGGLSDKDRTDMINRVCAQNFDKRTVGIELNMSCPNLDSPGPAYNSYDLDNSLRIILEKTGKIDVTFGLKFPPYHLESEFVQVAEVLENYPHQIDFITCINSIPGGIDFDIDNNTTRITPNDGYGGIGGKAVLPIGLANVRRFSTLLSNSIAIVGCGGVTTGEDVYKYFLAGASAVQIGTCLWREGPHVFQRIAGEFTHIMNRKGYDQLSQIPQC